MNGRVRFWISQTGQASFLHARSNAVVAIKSAFDREDIMIPFPIRTLDFGIRGGEKLSEMQMQVLSKDKASLSSNSNQH
jgi:small conductance mechanosensitive channel